MKTEPSNVINRSRQVPRSKATPSIDLKRLSRCMAEIALLEERVTGTKDEDFLGQAKIISLGLFRLVVMGEIKKGKSSFINALCGSRDLLPVYSDVATSTIFKLRYGPSPRYTVYFEASGANQPQKREISRAEVDIYGTESGNPNNERGVDFISVEAPSALLRGGLVTVMTQWLGVPRKALCSVRRRTSRR